MVSSTTPPTDKVPTSRELNAVLNEVIDTVKTQLEIRNLKKDGWLREGVRKIINGALAVQENISVLVAADTTGHASTAWGVIFLGLKMTQNYRDQQNIWFKSSEFLADTLSRVALIETRHYQTAHSETKEAIKNALVYTYTDLLRYSAEVMRIHESSTGKKSTIERGWLGLKEWVDIENYLDYHEMADLLQEIQEDGELSKLPIANMALFDAFSLVPNDEYWADNPRARPLFWLNGMAGTGKSTISRTVARAMHERGILGGSFFFSRSENDRSSSAKLIPTILHHLIRVLPQLKAGLPDAVGSATAAIPVQFENLLLKPLSNVKTSNGQKFLLVVVVDALDECEDVENIQYILMLLPRLQCTSSSVELRFFLTNKHQTAILHEIDEFVFENDVSIFFDRKLLNIRKRRNLQDSWPGEDILQALIAMAVPLFIFAATICREILEQRDDVVGAIVVLEDPLAIAPLSKLIGVAQTTVQARVQSMSSVLKVPKDSDQPVKLFHKSFRYGTLREDIPDDIIQGRLPAKLQYACRHWVHHLQRGKVSLTAQDNVHVFLKRHFLHWLEAMSILRYMSELVRDIDILQSLVKSQGESTIVEYIYDAKRFILKNIGIAQVAPLQLYASALVFSPQKCIVRTTFERHSPDFISQLPIVESDWGAELQTIQTSYDTAQTVAISPDDKLIASGSEEGNIKLWSRASGSLQLQQVLEGDAAEIYSVTFSPDGQFQTLVSGSHDTNVTLWHVETGIVKQTLKGHSRDVWSVAYSPDGHYFASCSSDRSIQLWDSASGALVVTLGGHSYAVNSLAFSSDSKLLLSSSWDQTMRLWDISSNMQHQKPKSDVEPIELVLFSPDRGFVLAGGRGPQQCYKVNSSLHRFNIDGLRRAGRLSTAMACRFW
ncbi:hypothetical protein BO71DRAFT_422881 [Aspergillus ellipticus CBS 707.79]|uniref:Nephrocystin 3-like N-terminal domain-containing protein n=1 Tax=Aspergillus ellipticus CBS 707.79 TaxID=1448320 RepID=A0A319EEY4_9EURO|nr:hypothetical protein BO71DRAFT_422881 [Aspergillus ellipticus CBS 707.79]